LNYLVTQIAIEKFIVKRPRIDKGTLSENELTLKCHDMAHAGD